MSRGLWVTRPSGARGDGCPTVAHHLPVHDVAQVALEDAHRLILWCGCSGGVSDEVELGSRNTRSLNRYFPELMTAARESLPDRCVLDG